MRDKIPGNAAISYADDGFVPGDKPMGRRTAGLGLLRGFVEHAAVDAFHGYGDSPDDRAGFERSIREFGGSAPVVWSDRRDVAGVRQSGALHLSGPIGAPFAFRRRGIDQRAWSLTGVTHTISTHTAMDAIVSLTTAPVQSWDALICTSRAVKSTVETVLAEQAEYLRARVGAASPVAPLQLPIIPLGVRCRDFDAAPAARAALRARLGIPDDDVLVLYAARLSFHSKAHPYPMYLALQRAAQRTGARVHLLLAGWFNRSAQEEVFRDGAAELCPDVTLHVVDGREPGVWDQVWQAGDIYALLSDNIQESFGLSPVEAMSAGLPVVGSDWDGLKDTIVHGQTGYLIPTLAPPEGSGAQMALAHAMGQIDYDRYIGAAAQAVAVDVGAAADAFAALIADPALRRRMGAAARARALADYDWRGVIGQYQALWTDLAARRRVDAEMAPVGPNRSGDPARGDPFRVFAAYPTRSLGVADRIVCGADLPAAAAALAVRPGANPVGGVVLGAAELELLTARMSAAGVVTVREAMGLAPAQSQGRVARTLTWLYKHGLVVIEPG